MLTVLLAPSVHGGEIFSIRTGPTGGSELQAAFWRTRGVGWPPQRDNLSTIVSDFTYCWLSAFSETHLLLPIPFLSPSYPPPHTKEPHHLGAALHPIRPAGAGSDSGLRLQNEKVEQKLRSRITESHWGSHYLPKSEYCTAIVRHIRVPTPTSIPAGQLTDLITWVGP